MNQIDIFVVVVMIIFGLIGLKTGLLKNVFSFAGIIVGIVFASMYYEKLAVYFSKLGWFDMLTNVISFLTIVLICYFISAYIAGKISNANTVTSFIDKILGTAFGLFQALLISSIILIMLNKVNFIPESVLSKSYFYNYTVGFAPSVFNFIAMWVPFVRPYIEQLSFIK
jgi:membrane protein required for colicin V production